MESLLVLAQCLHQIRAKPVSGECFSQVYFIFAITIWNDAQPVAFRFFTGSRKQGGKFNQLKAVLQARNDALQGHKQHGHNNVSGQVPKQEFIDKHA